MRLIVAILLLAFAATASAQEQSVEAPDPATTPATAERTYGQIVVVRTSYVHPSQIGEGAGYGTLNFRVARGRLVSQAAGYEIAPNSPVNSVELDVKQTGVRSPVFRAAFKAYSDALRQLAVEDYYTQAIRDALAADPQADVSAMQTKLAAIRAALQINE